MASQDQGSVPGPRGKRHRLPSEQLLAPFSGADAGLEKVLPEVSGPGKHLGRSLVSAPLLEQATADIEAFLGFFPLHKFCFQSGCLLCLTSSAEMKSLYPCPKEIGGRMVES